jgi:carbon-monoxide dehydrogenase medium subunit
MKPAPFDYVAPDSLAAALAAVSAGGAGAKLLAGGQSLVPMLNFRLAQPTLLVDLNRLSELDYIRPAEDGGLRLGAMVRQRRLERDPQVAARAPLLAEAVPSIAHAQIRNRGTLGGSLAHADPAAELPVVAVALRARLRLARAGGERWVDAAAFFAGLFATALEPDEVLVEVALPPPPPRAGWSFLEVSRRPGDYAQMGVAAMVALDEDGRCREARLVFLGAGTAPLEARRSAGRLLGERPAPAAIASVAEAARAEIAPREDVHASADFKRHLARVLTARGLALAAEWARHGSAAP